MVELGFTKGVEKQMIERGEGQSTRLEIESVGEKGDLSVSEKL